MIIINTLEDIEKAEITPKELKEEILQHFQDIAESVVDKYWKMYNLKEVGDIVVLEDDDSTTFILGDSFGITLYHKIGKIGTENENFLSLYKI